jgi:hypothetical protein
LGLALLALTGACLAVGALPASAASTDRWSIVISTARQLPQDVWIAANGNNTVGWRGGGVVCLGPLAQGFAPGDHATIQERVVAAGVLGIDGTPVPPGDYVAPGIELPDREFDVVAGKTFFVILSGKVVESNIPGIAVGSTSRIMFTFDMALGRNDVPVVAWFGTPTGFFPFLNEGIMMVNLTRHS